MRPSVLAAAHGPAELSSASPHSSTRPWSANGTWPSLPTRAPGPRSPHLPVRPCACRLPARPHYHPARRHGGLHPVQPAPGRARRGGRTADEVSGGRLDLGVGRGGPWVDLEVFGPGLARYETGFAESLDLLLAWLSSIGQIGADGRHFSFRSVTIVPRPARPVPVWVAATSEATADLPAGRLLG